MRIELLDLSHRADELVPHYRSLTRTHIRLLCSQVPESFLEKFEDEETALRELLDVIIGADHEQP